MTIWKINFPNTILLVNLSRLVIYFENWKKKQDYAEIVPGMSKRGDGADISTVTSLKWYHEQPARIKSFSSCEVMAI